MANSLSDVKLYGNRLIDALLDDVRLVEGEPTTTKAGQLYLKNGIPVYRNASNVESPFDTGVETVDAVTGSPLSVTMQGRSAIVDIAEASATSSGTLSAEMYSRLAGAAVENSPGSIVLRNETGDFAARIVEANSIHIYSAVTESYHATTKSYVDNLVESTVNGAVLNQHYKDPVDLLLNTNFDLASIPTAIQGVALVSGVTEVAFIGQTDATENGVYVFNSSGWMRRADANTAEELKNGATFAVTEGDFAGRITIVATSGTYEVDTDPLKFILVDDSLLAGDGLYKTGKTIHVGGTADRILVQDATIDIDPNYVGQNSISIVGEISEGSWYGDTISVESGGTGATNAFKAASNLQVLRNWYFTLGNGVDLFFDVTTPIPSGANEIDENWYTLTPTVTAYYQGELVNVRVVPQNMRTIRIFASKGSTPLEQDSLNIVISAKAEASS